MSHKYIILIALSFLFLFPYPKAAARQSQSLLTMKIEVFNSNNPSSLGQLLSLASSFQLPLAIEWSDADLGCGLDIVVIPKPVQPSRKPGQNKITSPPIQASDVTVEDVIRTILTPLPGYAIELNDGVIHIFDKDVAIDEKNFLNIRLQNVHLQQHDLSGVATELSRLIGEKSSIGKATNRLPGFHRNLNNPSTNPKFNIIGDNMTVREILNQTIRIHGNGMWIACLDTKQMDDFNWGFVAFKVREGR